MYVHRIQAHKSSAVEGNQTANAWFKHYAALLGMLVVLTGGCYTGRVPATVPALSSGL